MAPSPLKNVSPVKGKHYNSIPLCRPFKRVHCPDAIDESNINIPSASPVQSSHAGTSSGHVPPVAVKTEVPDVSPPRFT